MHSLEEQRLPESTASVLVTTTGFDEVSDSFSSNVSTVYGGYNNNTNVTVLVSVSSSGSSVSNVAPNTGGSGDILTRVTVSCVTCVAILLILIPLVIWRCRMCQKVTISSPTADKYGIFLLLFERCIAWTFMLTFTFIPLDIGKTSLTYKTLAAR